MADLITILHAKHYMRRARGADGKAREGVSDESAMNWRVRRNHARPALLLPDQVVAYVNHGRWLADCPCGAKMAVDREWAHGYCAGCGSKALVDWPTVDKMEKIERQLRRRPLPHANWLPGETIAELKAENVEHGYDGGD